MAALAVLVVMVCSGPFTPECCILMASVCMLCSIALPLDNCSTVILASFLYYCCIALRPPRSTSYKSMRASSFQHLLSPPRTGSSTSWPVPSGGTVWTACDRANVTVVHDVTTHTRLATIPLPRAVARVGGVPHDTISNDRFGYVSYIKNADGAGYVGVYDLVEFSLRRLVKNAADPLIGLFADSDVVLAAQGGMVSTYTQGLRGEAPATLHTTQPSPHGVAVSTDGQHAYTSNFAGGGDDAIVTHRLGADGAADAPQRGCPPIHTSRPTPHSLSLTSDDRVLLVTHSGANSTAVGLWDVDDDGCVVAGWERLVETGNHPFGV